MTLVYHDEPYKGGKLPIGDLMLNRNCVEYYAEHFHNYLYLKFIKDHPNSTTREKMEATKEIGIANRKTDFWFNVAKHQGRHNELREAEKKVLKKWQKGG